MPFDQRDHRLLVSPNERGGVIDRTIQVRRMLVLEDG